MRFTLRGRNLQRGHTGEDVQELQRCLLALDYYLGTRGPKGNGVDGSFGERTEIAVKAFQARNHDSQGNPLQVDGEVGPATEAALNSILENLLDPHDSAEEILLNVTVDTVLLTGLPLLIPETGRIRCRVVVSSPRTCM